MVEYQVICLYNILNTLNELKGELFKCLKISLRDVIRSVNKQYVMMGGTSL